MTLRLLTYVLLACAVGSTGIATTRRPELRPIALLLGFVLLSSAARAALPWGIAFELEAALVVLEPVALAVTASLVFQQPLGWAAPMLAAGAVVAAWSPLDLRRVYLAAELSGVTLSLGCAAGWVLRRELPLVEHVAMGMCITVEVLLVLAGPWRVGLWQEWSLAQVAYCVLYAAVSALSAWAWSWGGH